MATTTVPRRPATSFSDVELDSSAAHHLVLTTDDEAADHVGRPAGVSDLHMGGAEGGTLADALKAAWVGRRFVVVGRGAGGFAAGERDVYCAHCHAVTTRTAGIDESLTCSGCASPVVIYHHFSERHHAYLGFHPAAEELP